MRLFSIHKPSINIPNIVFYKGVQKLKIRTATIFVGEKRSFDKVRCPNK